MNGLEARSPILRQGASADVCVARLTVRALHRSLRATNGFPVEGTAVGTAILIRECSRDRARGTSPPPPCRSGWWSKPSCCPPAAGTASVGWEQRAIEPRIGADAAAEGLGSPSHASAAVSSLMNGAGLAAPPSLRGALRPTPFRRAPRPPHASPAPHIGGLDSMNQRLAACLVPAVIARRPSKGFRRSDLTEVRDCFRPSQNDLAFAMTANRPPGPKLERPTGLEPVAFPPPPSPRRGPGSRRSEDHAG